MLKLIKSLCLIAVLMTSSCVTRALWEETYKESFRDFLVSENGNYAAFLGQNYHYIFSDNSGAMKELLKWKNHGALFINFEKSYLKVDSDNDVSGYAIVETFSDKLSRDEENFLRALGFEYGKDNYSLSIKIKLSGKRYMLSTQFKNQTDHLQRTYITKIHHPSGIFKTAGKIAITPLTLTADSLYAIKEIILIPFKPPFRD